MSEVNHIRRDNNQIFLPNNESKIITIPQNIYNLSDDEFSNEDYSIYKLNTVVKSYFKNNDIAPVWGDIIYFASVNDYRNEGKFIWQDNNFIKLEYNYDDYGALPKQFTITENCVPANYWKNSIDHNCLINVEHEYYKEIINSGRKKRYIIEEENKKFFTSRINVGDKIYTFIYVGEDYEETNKKMLIEHFISSEQHFSYHAEFEFPNSDDYTVYIE